MKKPKPTKNRTELLRRRKIKEWWTPERKKAHSEKSIEIWDDEDRKKAKSEEQKTFWADHPDSVNAQSKRQKRVMRDRKRRKVQSKIMKKLKADPEFEALRLAGISKAEATEERKTARRATLSETLSKPAVSKRRKKNSAKAQLDPEYRDARSVEKKKFWADIRAAQDAHTAAKTRNGPGAPKKTERTRRILELRSLHPNWDRGDIAREMYPDYDKLGTQEKTNIRGAIAKVEFRQKQETPA
jgi:hypothetical protein